MRSVLTRIVRAQPPRKSSARVSRFFASLTESEIPSEQCAARSAESQEMETLPLLAVCGAARLKAYDYPAAFRSTHVDTFKVDKNGTIEVVQVPDPYVWLHDPDAEDTVRFVEAQNNVTDKFLEPQRADRVEIARQMRQYSNYEKVSKPFRRGDWMHYSYNPGLENHSRRMRIPVQALEDENWPKHEQAQCVLNPNQWSDDGSTALAATWFTRDGTHVAYAVQEKGSDWRTIRIARVDDLVTASSGIPWNEDDSIDTLRHCKFTSVAWTKDKQGLFYVRYPESGGTEGTETTQVQGQQVYYHRVGTVQSEDVRVLDTSMLGDSRWMFHLQTCHQDRTLVVSITDSCDPKNRLWLLDIEETVQDPSAPEIVKLVDDMQAGHEFVCSTDEFFFFKSNLEAPRNRT
ncbi:MAG: hypothetical protein MHM6MM_004708, partial [Cercozoa sp. M6MM]